MAKGVAVVLAGCGVFDGTEIHEASAVLVHLSRNGAGVPPPRRSATYLWRVPDLPEVTFNLSELGVKDFDAIVFPGWFGVAKSLCSWAVQGKDSCVNEQVKAALQASHAEKKPIGLCCTSPVLAAKVFPGTKSQLAMTKMKGAAEAITQLGCKHICKNVNETHVDEKNKIVTSCAFMCKAPLHEISDGIGVMIQNVLKLA